MKRKKICGYQHGCESFNTWQYSFIIIAGLFLIIVPKTRMTTSTVRFSLLLPTESLFLYKNSVFTPWICWLWVDLPVKGAAVIFSNVFFPIFPALIIMAFNSGAIVIFGAKPKPRMSPVLISVHKFSSRAPSSSC